MSRSRALTFPRAESTCVTPLCVHEVYFNTLCQAKEYVHRDTHVALTKRIEMGIRE